MMISERTKLTSDQMSMRRSSTEQGFSDMAPTNRKPKYLAESTGEDFNDQLAKLTRYADSFKLKQSDYLEKPSSHRRLVQASIDEKLTQVLHSHTSNKHLIKAKAENSPQQC